MRCIHGKHKEEGVDITIIITTGGISDIAVGEIHHHIALQIVLVRIGLGIRKTRVPPR